jgi:tripartite-type tricarboxylate transporter receptor subunit TctC
VLAGLRALLQSGKLPAIAIGSRMRSPSMPEVATMAELGMPHVEALHSAEVKDKYLSQGAIAVGNSSEDFAAYVKSVADSC